MFTNKPKEVKIPFNENYKSLTKNIEKKDPCKENGMIFHVCGSKKLILLKWLKETCLENSVRTIKIPIIFKELKRKV